MINALADKKRDIQSLIDQQPRAGFAVKRLLKKVAGSFQEGGPDDVYLERNNTRLVSKDGRRHLVSAEVRALPHEINREIMAYWEERHDVDNDLTPKQQLQRIRSQTLAIQAELGVLDGALSPLGKALVDKVLSNPTQADREKFFSAGDRPGVYAIHMKDNTDDKPGPRFAGTFIITRTDGSDHVTPKGTDPVPRTQNLGTAILYTPDRGFEEFEDIWSLHDHLARRMKNSKTHESLARYLPKSEQPEAIRDQNWFQKIWRSFPSISENVADEGVQSQLTKLSLDIAYGFKSHTISPIQLSALIRKIDDLSALSPQLDPVANVNVPAKKRNTINLSQPKAVADSSAVTTGELSDLQSADRSSRLTEKPTLLTGMSLAKTERLSLQQQTKFDDLAEEPLKTFNDIYEPILYVPTFINDFIEKGIARYEKNTGRPTHLHPGSTIAVTYSVPLSAKPITHRLNNINRIINFKLNEVVTNQHLYHTIQHGGDYRIVNIEYEKIIEEIKKIDISPLMSEALEKYQKSPQKVEKLKASYKEIIGLRCLEYLSTPHAPHAQAVKDFMMGKVQAKTVYFNGLLLNGVFFIPAGGKRGVLFSISDSTHFHVGEKSHHYNDKWKDSMITVPVFPEGVAFRRWVLSKLPVYDAQANEHSSFLSKETPPSSITGWYNIGKIYKEPFSFKSSTTQYELIDQLYQGLMHRLSSDIDTLVFTRKEQFTSEALLHVKKILALATIPLAMTPVGGGSFFVKTASFSGLLGTTGLMAATDVIQAYTTDRSDQAAAAFKDIILAALMSIPALLMGGVAYKAAVNGLFTPNNLMRAISVYRNASELTRRAMPSFLIGHLWKSMRTPDKINMLVNTIKNTKNAKELATMTTQSSVERSIRNNLLLDFEGVRRSPHLGPFNLEVAKANQRIASDLTILKDANANMLRLQKQSVPLELTVMPGKPEEAAAAWVLSNSTSGSTPSKQVLEILHKFKHADLLDLDVIDEIRKAAYLPPAGQPIRNFRLSSSPTFMGSDIAREGYKGFLQQLKVSKVKPEDWGEHLFAGTIKFHPYGDGNGRTARLLYALSQLKNETSVFTALTKSGEDILLNLNPNHLSAQNVTLQPFKPTNVDVLPPAKRTAVISANTINAHRAPVVPPTSHNTSVFQAPPLTASEAYIEKLLNMRNSVQEMYPSIKSIAQLKTMNFPLPATVYRAHVGPGDVSTGLLRAAGAAEAGDDYLSAIIKHSTRTSGSGGEVLSLTTKALKAEGFSKSYNGDGMKNTVYSINTTTNPSAFQTLSEIILKNGQRLVQAGKINPATILGAIDKIPLGENEVFYILRDIPADLVIKSKSFLS
ncbi:hypothetical protein [Pseudomonas fluorescens]|uniref:hypothetical protein n=1 Tax=Pseudomonas fluorescens TaxID=294 RepID=UPI001BE63FC1|nr:hypothetical protein [Pseudomonas fluorescens]MBT2375395.1 hypothetical protein [Pseudomonas fluorescens]